MPSRSCACRQRDRGGVGPGLAGRFHRKAGWASGQTKLRLRLMKFFFLWGGAIALAWAVFVVGTTAILNSSQGPLAGQPEQ
jgi:hypothetical protein